MHSPLRSHHPRCRCVRPLRTVHTLLGERGALALLEDPHLELATGEIVAGELPRHEVQKRIKVRPTGLLGRDGGRQGGAWRAHAGPRAICSGCICCASRHKTASDRYAQSAPCHLCIACCPPALADEGARRKFCTASTLSQTTTHTFSSTATQWTGGWLAVACLHVGLLFA